MKKVVVGAGLIAILLGVWFWGRSGSQPAAPDHAGSSAVTVGIGDGKRTTAASGTSNEAAQVSVETLSPALLPTWMPAARTTRTLYGVVLVDGTPENATLQIRFANEGLLHAVRHEVAPGGRFLVESLPAGALVVSVAAQGAVSAQFDVDLAELPDGPPQVFALVGCAGVVNVQVQDQNRQVVAGAKVSSGAESKVTDADGMVSVCVGMRGSRVVVEADGFARVAKQLKPAMQTKVVVTLIPSAKLEVLVRQNGVAFAGAAVMARQKSMDGASREEAMASSALTDSRGLAELDSLLPGEFFVTAQGPWGLQTARVNIAVGETVRHVFDVPAFAEVAGRVLEQGKPVANLPVYCMGTTAHTMSDGGFVIPCASGEGETVNLTFEGREVIGPDGKPAEFLAVKRGQRDVTVALAPQAHIIGRVTSRGQPAPYAQVTCSFMSTRADGLGYYDLAISSYGKNDCELQAASTDEMGFGETPYKFAEGVTKLNIELQYDAKVSGRVVDQQDKPVPTAEVNLKCEAKDDWGFAITDASGSYLAGAMRGNCRYVPSVKVAGEEVRVVSASQDLITGPGTTTSMDIVVDTGLGQLRGTVVAANGGPVIDALVEISGTGKSTRTDEDGHFEIACQCKDVIVLARHPAHGDALVVVASTATKPVLKFGEVGTLEISAPGGVGVILQHQATREFRYLPSTQAPITGLLPGRYKLFDNGLRTTTAVVVAHQTTKVSVEAAPIEK